MFERTENVFETASTEKCTYSHNRPMDRVRFGRTRLNAVDKRWYEKRNVTEWTKAEKS